MSRLRQGPRIVRAVQPIRVLVASRDKRFMRVTSFLLRRAGFGVEVLSRPDAMVVVVDEQDPTVVVLDVESAAEAEHVVAELIASNPLLNIVVLTDETAAVQSSDRIRAVGRWCPFDQLVQEIEAACMPPPAAV